jgi:NADPH:quinone reductase-like Zn-dependent oxidoreductase
MIKPMELMNCAWVVESAGVLTLEPAKTAKPRPQQGEVLVQVRAAGVTPTELLWSPTSKYQDGSPRTHAIPGHEFSGVIAETGSGVTGFSVGDEIYGMNDWFADGTTAEYCITVPASIAPKPRRLSHPEAATVPIGALTAWQGLFDRAKLRVGERVLVHGAAGAVGIFVVQIAAGHGAEVIATASAHNRDFLLQLGAKRVIDYTSVPFENEARDIDVVFDGVGGETLSRSWGVLKTSGRMVTIAADSEATKDERVKDAFFIVEANQQQLIEIAERLDSGRLRTFVDAEVPLADAPLAYGRKVRKHRYGKVVIVPSH